eukprot:TRINITY_DN1124_c0_g2_i7.p1 TRINITY_DN1124_c0_g2~~TRINITY_DN1124_c0_g2_i7.p1  ORF type:complete len:101 (-),score=2.19 TRINITY_DN1124_c0_g2_i7:821-1123(-)
MSFCHGSFFRYCKRCFLGTMCFMFVLIIILIFAVLILGVKYADYNIIVFQESEVVVLNCTILESQISKVFSSESCTSRLCDVLYLVDYNVCLVMFNLKCY